MKTDIIWFIEHSSRELDVACAVSVLIKKNYDKLIKIFPYQKYDLRRTNPQLVLLPYCYSIMNSVLQYYLRLWPKAVFMNLAWEQIFYKANLEYKSPRDNFAKTCTIHHSWSEDRARFLKARGVPKTHLFINGHPAYKLYDLPYRRVYVKRLELAREYNLDAKKKWIFFPENYSWFFYSDYNLEEIIRNGQDRKTAYLMRDYCKEAFLEVISWVENAVDKYRDKIEIILRPRPSFGLHYFKKRLNQINPRLGRKIHILQDYSVREWILASDIVISSFSTSLIEAAIAGKPTYMLEPVKIPEPLSAVWYHYVKKIIKKDNFLNIISQTHQNDVSLEMRDWAREKFFVKGDPILGLTKFLGSFKTERYLFLNQKQEEIIKKIKQARVTLLKNFLTDKLGTLKRNLFKETEYHSHENQAHFMTEMEKRINIFQKIL